MALTESMQELIQALKVWGVEKEDIVALLLMMETDEQARQMIDWLLENKDRDTTLTDLLTAALKIRQATKTPMMA